MESGLYNYEGVGVVRVMVRANARRVTARWKQDMIHVSTPGHVTHQQLHDILLAFMPRLAEARPDLPYSLGQRIEFADFSVAISRQSHAPDKMLASMPDGRNGRIEVGDNWDMRSADTMKAINRFVCRMAQRIAPGVLLPRGRQLAADLGCSPLAWEISNGHRTLGRCSSRGVICLSYALLFYPPHLRDYVICHELAHLTELNHSPAFHSICDSYCGGRERQLEAELRAFKAPMLF